MLSIDGNVQMNVHESIEDAVTVDASDPSGVVKAISEFESGVQAKVGKEFSLLTEEVFKNMRRILPVFRSKIKWETIAGCMDASFHLILCRQNQRRAQRAKVA